MECIEEAKRIIATQIVYNKIFRLNETYAEYQRCFFWTNENISAYLDLTDFNEKESALAVASSGDQAFNLINKGVLNIDTFDINKLTEYFAFGFKRAMILKYDYKSFCKIITEIRKTDNIEYISDIIIGLLPYMESKHAIFWQTLVDYNNDLQREFQTKLNLLLMLTYEKEVDIFKKALNNYLKSEEEYEKLRKNLWLANISFKNANAKDLAKEFSKEYDFILLSNILDNFNGIWGDCWTKDKLEEYIKNLERITKTDGIIFLHYLMFYVIDDKIKKLPFNDSQVVIKDLSNVEVHQISLKYLPEVKDGIILKRVKG